MADKFQLMTSTDSIAKNVDQRLIKSRFVMVAVGTGGGKTYIGIHAVGRIIPDAHIIVFAPKKKVDEKDWDKSIDSYNDVMGTDLVYDVFNYELLVHGKHVKKINDLFHQYTLKKCPKKRHIVILLDEAHRIKDPTSKTSKSIQRLSNHVSCKRVIGLSATPVSNSYMDAVAYFILSGFYTSKTQFMRRHVKFYDEYNQPIVKRQDGTIDRNLFYEPDNLDVLMQHIFIDVDLEHLKPKRHGRTIEMDYPKETLKAYRKIKKDYRDGVYEHVQEALSAMRTFIAENADQKNAALSTILNNSFITRPVLIFYSYNAELDALRAYLDEHHADFDRIEINGQTRIKEEDLQEPKNPRTIFLIQYRSGSEGLDAKWSNVTVFYAPTNMYQAFKQAMGRNVRANQKTGDVYQFRLCMNNTLDADTWEILEKKQDFTNELMQKYMHDADLDALLEAEAYARESRSPVDVMKQQQQSMNQRANARKAAFDAVAPTPDPNYQQYTELNKNGQSPF